MAELADALDLGSNGHTRAGSTPVTRTRKKARESVLFSIKSVLADGINHSVMKSLRNEIRTTRVGK